MVKRALLQPYFIGGIFLYLAVRLARIEKFELPEILNNYLTDLICMPLVLTLSCILVRQIKRDHAVILSPLMVLGMTLFYAWYFEYYLPQQSTSYTSDWIDSICYFFGSILYLTIIQPRYLKPINKSEVLI